MRLSFISIPIASIIFLFSACGSGQKGLNTDAPEAAEGDPFPPFIGISVKGATIDNTAFNDRVTLVSAWRLGCRWSMLEIAEYNKMIGEIQNDRFQVISFAPHTKDEMEAFYRRDESMLNQIKEAIDVPIAVPEYDVLPRCSLKRFSQPDTIAAQCDALRDMLGVEEFPVTFVVGPDGVIRHRHDGLIVNEDTMEPDISEFRADLDSLLRVL